MEQVNEHLEIIKNLRGLFDAGKVNNWDVAAGLYQLHKNKTHKKLGYNRLEDFWFDTFGIHGRKAYYDISVYGKFVENYKDQSPEIKTILNNQLRLIGMTKARSLLALKIKDPRKLIATIGIEVLAEQRSVSQLNGYVNETLGKTPVKTVEDQDQEKDLNLRLHRTIHDIRLIHKVKTKLEAMEVAVGMLEEYVEICKGKP